MLSGREAPQLCFPKRPLRTRLELSCLAASQLELVEAHERLLEHFNSSSRFRMNARNRHNMAAIYRNRSKRKRESAPCGIYPQAVALKQNVSALGQKRTHTVQRKTDRGGHLAALE
jgi:hypothetical protein